MQNLVRARVWDPYFSRWILATMRGSSQRSFWVLVLAQVPFLHTLADVNIPFLPVFFSFFACVSIGMSDLW